MSKPDDLSFRDAARQSRYEADLGDAVAILEYQTRGDRIVFTHTQVPEEHQGEGIGTALVRYALDDVREQGLGVVPMCPFVQAFIQQHADYRDLVAEDA